MPSHLRQGLGSDKRAASMGFPSGPSQVAATLVEAVRALAADTKRGFVFVQPDGGERLYSFCDIAAEAERRGAAIRGLGVDKGDRVAMVVPAGDEFVLSFLGALFAGVVPVPIFPQLTLKNVEAYHETVAHIVRASGASLLLATDAAKPFVEPVRSRAASLRAVVSVSDLAAAPGSRCDVPVSGDDLAFLQFTSGSTSRPKGVMVSHRNLAANAEAFMIHGLDRDPSVDKGVSWLPLFHDMGLIGFVVGPLFTDIPCVFMPTASFVRAPRLWLDKIHQHRGTITYAPNFAYALVAKRLKDKDVEGLDLSCLRVAGCGAEPIQPRALRDFATRLAPAGFDARAFLPSYGMAEATLAVTFVPKGEGLRTDDVDPTALAAGRATPSDGEARARSIVDCGRAFPGHRIAILDAAGEVLGDRQVGQIVVSGPSVARGYFDQPELTAATFGPIAGRGDGTWLHTGDLGYLSGGRLFVCGRVKDVIIVRGRNYYPSDIEWAVGEVSHVRRGNVVAFGIQANAEGILVSDGSGEEQLVVCCEGASADAEAIREAAAACVAEQFGLTVHEVVVVPLASLPRTSSGKPQRNATRRMYIEGDLRRAKSVAMPEARGLFEQPESDA
jgi:fatty-acyl-CoA synthase